MYKRKIVPYGEGYMTLKLNGDGYHRKGHALKDFRALLNYVQNERGKASFDLSEVGRDVRVRLEAIIAGTKTVRESDWNPDGEHRAKV
ncbi:MAG: hypothetical protein V1645_04740 [archaeon]